jgi:hypothetical protein
MNKTGNKCIECGEETYAIQLIDRGDMNVHYNLSYTTDDFKRKPRTYHINGHVAAEMCENCRRITLRAAPND